MTNHDFEDVCKLFGIRIQSDDALERSWERSRISGIES